MLLLICCWLCWCALHSLLITHKLTAWVRHRGGVLHGAYRLGYSLFSAASLAPILWYQYNLPREQLFAWSGWWRVPQGLLLAYALVMLYGGYRVYDLGYLVGTSQWRRYRRGEQSRDPPFFCQGALRYVRHPWYSAGLPILWTVGPITDTGLPMRIILSLYLVIGTLLEERKLVAELGAPYRSYRGQVPMLVPWKGRVEVQGIEGVSPQERGDRLG